MVLLAHIGTANAQPAQACDHPLAYPGTKMVDVVEELHGVKIADPYRWMEDLDSPEVKAWIDAQNEVTFGYLAQIPERERINKRLTELWDHEKYGTPYKRGTRYFFSKNDGLQNQYVLYVAESLDTEPRVLLNPNQLSEDGTIALAGTSVSEDGKLLAYGLSEAGSDWVEYHVRDIDTGRDLPDHIRWVKFSGASWTKDGEGFFYSRYDEPKGDRLVDANYYQKLYYHQIGAAQSEDVLVYDRPDQKEWGFGCDLSDDGRYLAISVWQGTERNNRVYYKDLQAGSGEVVKLLDDSDAQYRLIDNDGPVFWFFTDLDAPRGRVIAIDIRSPDRDNWKEIIPEAAETLRGVNVVNDTFIATYLKDAHSQIKMFDLSGSFLREVGLPGLGSAGGFGGKRTDTETFYVFSSFSHPTTIYRYDMTVHESTVFKRPTVDFDPEQYVTRQVFYHSKDGTRVPMFITHKKGLKLDGSNPTLLTGYGGFNISMTPYFSATMFPWYEAGGVMALPNLR
ncbi:MAG: S9 family peptidase, partial [Planctomycetes bacterium]|nr:S9 family peptidase [Planctomycetota bacterium]